MSDAHITPPTYWPIIGSVALFCFMLGLVNWLHDNEIGPYLMLFGFVTLIYMLYGWFAEVIAEGLNGLNEDKVLDKSFRWGMFWFIFSEIMFFVTFFGALFFVRLFVLPVLAGNMGYVTTHYLLWPDFENTWPLLKTPDQSQFLGPSGVMELWGIPAINTLILLTSGLTLTVAHWGVVKKRYFQAIIWQAATILLGIVFLVMQAYEYGEAYFHKSLRLDAGIYGNTFYFLTGFHGLHVTLGTVMLIIILYRIICKHFTPKHHFAFEAVAWYWHFVDVVWLLLFVFVYWI